MYAGTIVLLTLLFSTALSLPHLTSPAAAPLTPGDIVVLDRSLGTNRRGSLVRIDPATGTRTLFSDFGDPSQGPLVVGVGLRSAALHPAGDIVVIDGGTSLFRVNAVTGHRTLLGRFTNRNINPQALAIDAAGSIWVGSLSGGTGFRGALFRFDSATGRETRVSDLGDATQGPVELNARGMALEPSGHILLTAWGRGTTTHLVRVDPATGARTVLSDFRDAAQGPLGHNPTGVAVLPAGKTILVADPNIGPNSRGILFCIDAITGIRTVQWGFGPPAQAPQWVALDAAGDVLVSDQHAELDRTTPGRGALFKVALAPRDPRTPLTVASDYGDPTQGLTISHVISVMVVPFQFTSGDIIVPEDRGLIPWTGLVAPGVLVRVNPVTGERHIFSNFQNRGQGPLGTPQAVTFDGAGNLLVTARRLGRDRPGVLLRVDPATEVRTVVSDFGNITQGPLGGVPGAMTTDARGNLLVLAADGGTNHRVLLFSVNPISGERRVLSNFNDRGQGPRGANPTSVASDAAGTILVVDRNAGQDERRVLFRIDPATGNRQVVTNFNNPADGLLGIDPNDVTIDARGAIWVIDPARPAGDPSWHHGRLFRVRARNGARLLISDFTDPAQGPLGLSPISVTIDPFRRIPNHVLVGEAGSFIGIEPNIIFAHGRLVRVNTATGERTLLSDFGDPAQGPVLYHPGKAAVVP